MKIFYLTSAKLPSQHPQSVHAMKMAQAFAKDGHEVRLFAKRVNGTDTQEIFKIYDTTPCFELSLSTRLPIRLLSRLRLLREISNAATKTARPDLIYGHDPIALSLFARENIPVIYEAPFVPEFTAHRMAFSRLINSPCLKSVVVVSDLLKQEFLRVYPELDAQQIFVAHDGADLIENLSTRAQTDVTLRGRAYALNVGYAGSLHPGKGLALIQALAKIRPDYGFHILGGTQKHVQKLQTEQTLKNIHYYGHHDHCDVPAYLKAFDVCLAPYQHRALIKTRLNASRWISPMKIFEYMAAKKPIISSNLPIIQEILEHETSALLLPAAYEEHWASALDLLKDNPDVGVRLAENAYNSLRTKYTWDKRAHAIIDISMSDVSPVHLAKEA